jgi:hypothetical protein
MLVSTGKLYRPAAVDYQRRRLAGEVRLYPPRRFLLACTGFVSVACGALVAAVGWEVETRISGRCGVEATAGLADARVLARERSVGGDGACTERLRVRYRPLATALGRLRGAETGA